MSPADEIRDLYAYNAWANDRMLEAAGTLGPGQLVQDLGSSFPSVRDTLVHVLGAEWIWLERWRGESPRNVPADLQPLDLSAISERWQDVRAGQAALLDALDDEGLVRVVAYTDMSGTAQRSPMWQMLRHVVNHSSYHRGQLTTMLRQLGASAPKTDLIHWYRSVSS